MACGGSHSIERRPILEPLELPFIQSVVDGEAVGLAIGLLALQSEGLSRCELCDALDGYSVKGSNLHRKICHSNLIEHSLQTL